MGLQIHDNTTRRVLSLPGQFPVESWPHGCFAYSLLFVVPLDRSKERNTADLCTAMRHRCHSISVNKATLLPHLMALSNGTLRKGEKSSLSGRPLVLLPSPMLLRQGLWHYGDTKDHRVRAQAKVCASFEEIEAPTHRWRGNLKVGSRVKTDSV